MVMKVLTSLWHKKEKNYFNALSSIYWLHLNEHRNEMSWVTGTDAMANQGNWFIYSFNGVCLISRCYNITFDNDQLIFVVSIVTIVKHCHLSSWILKLLNVLFYNNFDSLLDFKEVL